MHLRRNRVHLQGKTNKDFKMIDTFEMKKDYSFDQPRIDKLAVSKPQKFSEILEAKQKRIVQYKDPEEETKLNAKKHYDHHKIGYPRSAQLEEAELRKRVFCGDSNTLLTEEDKRRIEESPKHMKLDKEKLAFKKREENTAGIQETQLVGIGENKYTLEGKVDLEKVREIRRAIRRRYANRKNFQKIFNLWDEDSNGAISIKNLYNMIQRLGIKINIDEARVLLASADRDCTNDLGLDEFLDLIFNDKDVLNVNLNSLPSLSEHEKDSLLQNQETINLLRLDAQKARDRRHENQVHQILKNRVQQIWQWLGQQDELQKGYVNFSKFESVLKRLEIDQHIMTEDDVKILYQKFKSPDDTVDYKKFITHLRNFQLQEEVYQDPFRDQEMNHIDKKQLLLKEMKNQEQQKINVFDLTRVNAWHLERMRTRTRNLMAKLQRYLPTKEKFDEFLKSKTDKNYITVQDFSHALTSYLETVNESYHRFDIESILSAIQFGQHEIQNLEEISKYLYEENDQEFYDRAQLRKKQPAPPSGQIEKESKQKQLLTTQSASQIEYFNQDLGMKQIPPHQKQELNKVLVKIENAFFNKSERAYKLFTEFDKDRDGYISQKDLQTKLLECNVLNDGEIQTLIEYVDPNNKGYATFAEFHNKIRAGMSILDDKGTQLIQQNTQPGKSQILAIKSFLPEMQKQTEEFKLPYKPSNNNMIPRPATRFGSTPSYKNTFVMIVPGKQTPQYIGPQEIFNKNREQFIQEEKQKKSQYYEGKLNRIRNYQNQIQNRIQSAQDVIESRDINHLKSKAMAQWTYDHKAHLKNDYL